VDGARITLRTMNTEAKKQTTAKDDEAAMLLQSELAAGLRTQIGLLPEYAHQWAGLLAAYLRLRLGGQQIYITAPSKAERDAAIYREFDGTNAGDLMRRHDVSRSRLYQIVEEQRELHRPGGAYCPVSSLKTGQGAG
jgi:Mor family transcriptional regulator